MFGGGSTFGGFGQPAATSQPATSAPLFGAAPTSTAPSLFGAPKPATTTPSLFGAPATSAPAPTGGLFGSTSAPKPAFTGFGAPASTGGSLFGTPAPATAAPGATGGLFGQPAQQQQQGGGLFGSSTQGKSLFGSAAPAAPAPTAPPAPGQGAPDQFTKSTKFNDLPDAARSAIEGIESSIRSQIQISEELKTRDLGKDITTTTSLYEQYSSEATAVSIMLSQDSRLADELRQQLEVDLADLAKATAIIEGYKNPQQKGAQAKAVANFPFEYFSRKTDEFRERLSHYKSTMDQIQCQVDSTHSLSRNPSAIVPTLRAQHTSFMALASAIASLDLQLKRLKDDYRVIWREKTGNSVLDPFKASRTKDGSVERGVRAMEIR